MPRLTSMLTSAVPKKASEAADQVHDRIEQRHLARPAAACRSIEAAAEKVSGVMTSSGISCSFSKPSPICR